MFLGNGTVGCYEGNWDASKKQQKEGKESNIIDQ
jgi:hypothetical protein